jgi:predicted nicotinamide N-methyase
MFRVLDVTQVKKIEPERCRPGRTSRSPEAGRDNDRVPEPLLTLTVVPFVPEIRLWLADETTGLWDSTDGGYRTDQPPPFWAFAWAGGVGLARFVLDHPAAVRGLRVLDLGAGSGIVAIAAAQAGAAAVVAADTDPDAEPAINRNALANDVPIVIRVGDPLLDDAVDADVILIGDMFYSPPIVNRLMRYLRRAQAANPSIRILASDPNRGYLTPDRFEELAAYQVPVRQALEETSSMTATIWQLRPRPQ